MSEELNVKEVEVAKIKLQDGDVLMVTVTHEDLDEYGLNSLKTKLDSLFPANEVMIFGMGKEGSVKFAIASQPKLSYCSGCDCGKKEIAEGLAKQENKDDQS